MPDKLPVTLPTVAAKRGQPQGMLIRLDTLIRLRWYAIVGQLGAVLIVAFGFGYEMPWMACITLIAAAVLLNLWLGYRVHNHSRTRIRANDVFMLLTFDVVQLAALLYLTGGLDNPFSILLIAPVIVSSTSLTRNHTIMLGVLVALIVSTLAIYHLPLPWRDGEVMSMPPLYLAGIWTALICTLGFTAIYAFRVAQEARKLGDALSATELVLQREKHLSALDGLAAAAAHELGTPLATIALVSKEMLRELPQDSDLAEDAALLRTQAERCREILSKLTSLSSAGEPIMERQSLNALIEEVVDPLRTIGAPVKVKRLGDKVTIPHFDRSLGVRYGLGSIIENAVDFADNHVSVQANWDTSHIEILVSDDGPGFPSSILRRAGEPFISRRRDIPGRSRKEGMGLGLFIAKTLLERSGATVTFSNGLPNEPEHGARVRVIWPRELLEPTGRQGEQAKSL
jgi:two-component system sensor histidine kinase RegB